MTLAPAATFCAGFGTGSRQKEPKRSHCGSIHTLQPPPDQGETRAMFGCDRFRNVDLYKVQTNNNEQKPISTFCT
jgi:hypothetical protein